MRSGVRKVVDVVFAYANRQTDVLEKYFVYVGETEEFPFLVIQAVALLRPLNPTASRER